MGTFVMIRNYFELHLDTRLKRLSACIREISRHCKDRVQQSKNLVLVPQIFLWESLGWDDATLQADKIHASHFAQENRLFPI